MITTLKLASLSAVLSAGLVGGFSTPDVRADADAGKVFYDRLPDGNMPARITLSSTDPRAMVPVDVNRSAKADRERLLPHAEPSAARTSERRIDGNVSVLVRHLPSQALASR